MQNPLPSHDYVGLVKRQVASEHRLSRVPKNSEIIQLLDTEQKEKLLRVLRIKTTRTISGVTVVAAMTKPHPCPQAKPCAYCPGGPPFGVPQSYTGFEPAAMRGIQNQFDPHSQVKNRIKQLQTIGHTVDKIELIIMGGTFPANPPDYQTWFIQRCLDAITNMRSSSLKEAKKNAETSPIRNVGITVETRPDWAKKAHVDQMLEMGVTRVELGVQNPDDEIYRLVGRKHTVKDVVESTRTMKDAGLKIVYHLMPGLPGTDPRKDAQIFKQIFTSPDFKPDMVKIYPCLVIEGTKTYKWYKKGEYEPYTETIAADLIAEMKKTVPPWIRIMRIQRDIPAPMIVAGVKKSNLRQLVSKRLKEQGVRCKCIRCREVGHRMMKEKAKLVPEKVKITNLKYSASEGEEIFISAEDPEENLLAGYLRMRVPSKQAHRPEIVADPCSIVRELHICGPVVRVGAQVPEAWQHKGYGGTLLREAERISSEDYETTKILILSGLGTKRYYMRFNYHYDGVYMSKKLENRR
ncbi:tRNA uridine(34) 5-carboxymethylaminomethyl modification radical SAM/GNAT enzyme Elp3 [Candidatus Bathyarchaeota archaeon]|nr:tRNA uridine(34) 5-carboxymethylaminomethyl modification radical SAM/GNAT enzyme Elp3 [Candidatus Bathyarchaeota archaeon]